MERVSFKVAKAIKEAKYPQDPNCDKYVTEPCKGLFLWYTPNPDCTRKDDDNYIYDFEVGEYVDHEMYSVSITHSASAPTYLEVWLWLWRKKNIKIDIDYCINKCAIFDITQEVIYSRTFDDPEEAIIAAIEYLVEQNMIK